MLNTKKKVVKPMGRILVAWILATAVLAFVATPAVATIITVNSLADNESSGNGFCTLREAMQNANNDAELSSGDCLGGADYDAIVFSTGPGTILIDSGLPRVTTEMAIIGPATGNMIVRGPPLFLGSHFRVEGSGADLLLERVDVRVSSLFACVTVVARATVRIDHGNLFCAKGIGITSGSTLTLDSSSIGGTRGIDIVAGTFTTSITVVDSTIGGTSRGIGADAFGDAEIIIDVQNSTLTGNRGVYIDALDESTVTAHVVDSIVADTSTGLIFYSRGSGGDSTVSALVERTALRNNSFRGIEIGGISSPAFVTLNDSTIEGSDVGIRNTNDLGHLFITNSTISGNGHGVDNGDDVATGGAVNFTHATVANNGRGIFTEESAYTNINRTILADNDIDCAGEAPGSTGYNVVGVDCGISASTADIIGTVGSPVDPRLFQLADNGGPTKTHQLRADSPAVDRTDLATCFIGHDQRGIPRPVGNGCDAGSYELEDLTPPDITVPGLITKEATGPGGAVVTYLVTATDNLDPDPDLFCSPTSGSLFPIGTTTVFCTATDLLGNVAQADFDVTAQDTTPPSLILIGAAEIEVIEGNSYDDPGANAFDIVDGNLTTEIVITNPVDTTVPDVYTVSYDVTDNAGNTTDTLTRTVTVIGQAAAAEDLVETVESFGLPNSVSRSLIQLMTNVARYLDDDEANDAEAQDLLDRFIKQVQKRLNKGRLTQAQAELLIAKAEELQSALDG